jgi:hypothetical protein
MLKGDYHAFPREIDKLAGRGKVTQFKGGDGVTRTKVELRGPHDGKNGTFEWIIEPDRTINHRLFRPDKK